MPIHMRSRAATNLGPVIVETSDGDAVAVDQPPPLRAVVALAIAVAVVALEASVDRV